MIALAPGTSTTQIHDGQIIELYAGIPATATRVAQFRFNAAQPNLTLAVDPALDYTLVLERTEGLLLFMIPNTEPPADKLFSADFDPAFG